jgi:hypothetical protein
VGQSSTKTPKIRGPVESIWALNNSVQKEQKVRPSQPTENQTQPVGDEGNLRKEKPPQAETKGSEKSNKDSSTKDAQPAPATGQRGPAAGVDLSSSKTPTTPKIRGPLDSIWAPNNKGKAPQTETKLVEKSDKAQQSREIENSTENTQPAQPRGQQPDPNTTRKSQDVVNNTEGPRTNPAQRPQEDDNSTLGPPSNTMQQPQGDANSAEDPTENQSDSSADESPVEEVVGMEFSRHAPAAGKKRKPRTKDKSKGPRWSEEDKRLKAAQRSQKDDNSAGRAPSIQMETQPSQPADQPAQVGGQSAQPAHQPTQVEVQPTQVEDQSTQVEDQSTQVGDQSTQVEDQSTQVEDQFTQAEDRSNQDEAQPTNSAEEYLSHLINNQRRNRRQAETADERRKPALEQQALAEETARHAGNPMNRRPQTEYQSARPDAARQPYQAGYRPYQAADQSNQADDEPSESDGEGLSDLTRDRRRRHREDLIALSNLRDQENHETFGYPLDGRVPGGRRRATEPPGQSLGRDNYQVSQSLAVTQKERIAKKEKADEEKKKKAKEAAAEALSTPPEPQQGRPDSTEETQPSPAQESQDNVGGPVDPQTNPVQPPQEDDNSTEVAPTSAEHHPGAAAAVGVPVFSGTKKQVNKQTKEWKRSHDSQAGVSNYGGAPQELTRKQGVMIHRTERTGPRRNMSNSG